MKFAIVQTSGFNCEEYSSHAGELIEMIQTAASDGADMIVFPECTIPGYYISPSIDKCMEYIRNSEYLDSIGEIAAKNSVYIAMGCIREEAGKLFNSVIVFGPDGQIVAKADKSNMWHIDRDLFTPGKEYCVFDSPFGRIGVMICADARIPEIARILKLNGAQVIVDSANLVSNAPEKSLLTNQQLQFIVATRAAENRIPIVLANKCSSEYDSIFFAGQSFVVDKEGTLISQASVDQEEILYADVELSSDNVPLRRKPALYARIADASLSSSLQKRFDSPCRLQDLHKFIALIRVGNCLQSEYLDKSSFFIKNADMQHADISVLSPCGYRINPNTFFERFGYSLSPGKTVIFSSYTENDAVAYIMDCEGVRQISPTHLDSCNDYISAVDCNGIRLGFIFGDELFVPEISRCLMLDGAECIIWMNRDVSDKEMRAIRTRAAENKIFTICSSLFGRSCSINPDGNVYASTFIDQSMLVTCLLDISLARNKTVVPGTEIIMGRIPFAYSRLLED